MRHTILYKSLFLIVALLAIAIPSKTEAETIRLNVGQSHSIRSKRAITRVHILNPSIADAFTENTYTVTLVGKRSGTTEVIIRSGRKRRRVNVIVSTVETGQLYKEVKRHIGRVEGIYIKRVGNEVVIFGWALTADDYRKAQEAVKLFGNTVKNLVRFKTSAVEQINQIFASSGLTDVKARLIGGTVFLEGSVGSKEEMGKVNAILRTYGLQVENLVREGGGKQILIEVEFVEMRKGDQTKIGFSWPNVLGVTKLNGEITSNIPLSPKGTKVTTLDLNGTIEAGKLALEALYESGNARLLAQPKLVCGSGKKAEFLVGGEVPIVQITQNVVNIEFKPYGIRLKILPTADSLGNVRAKIYAEVSEVDETVQVQGIPGFRTRKFDTFVTVKDGASIALSGLFSNTEQKAVSKFPILGHIPILGELFKSRKFQNAKTTLVVFVTPRIVSSDHQWVRQQIKGIQKLYSDYKDEVSFSVFD